MYPQPIASRLRPNGTPDSLTFPSMLAWMKSWYFFMQNCGPVKYPPTKNECEKNSRSEGTSVSACAASFFESLSFGRPPS